MFPEELRYTAEHEWVSAPNADGIVRIGITSYAQEALGDVVYVSVPDAGGEIDAGAPLGEVESTKSVSDIYAPVSGTVVAKNASLTDEPELINAEPYAAGWLVEIAPADPGAIGGLLDAGAFKALTES